MLFYDRKVVAMAYQAWLIHESNNIEPTDCEIEDCPESFLCFLQIKGWLKEDEIVKFTRRKEGDKIDLHRSISPEA